MSYERLLSLQSLSEVASPWRGLTLNRCLVLALLLVLVSSGVNEVNEALGSVLEQTGLLGGGGLEEGVAAQPTRPLWEAVVGWVWGDEEDEEAARMKKKQRLGGTMRLRNKEAIRSGLLKQEDREGRL